MGGGVGGVGGDFAVLAPGHRIAVDVSETALIRADHECIEQVLFNLIENAVKYSPDPRPITVQVRIVDGRIRCRVADQGIGVLRRSELEPDSVVSPADGSAARNSRFGCLGGGRVGSSTEVNSA